MMFGKIVIFLLLGYALWVFVTTACMGGIQGYRQRRRDHARLLKQLKAARQSGMGPGHNTFDKIFG